MHNEVEFVVEQDSVVAPGFLAIRRMILRNKRPDGSLSKPYKVDFAIRGMGLDAVVVALYRRSSSGAVEVLLRDGLRPALYFGRVDQPSMPVPDPKRYRYLREVVAGIIEPGDDGIQGVRRRAAIEVLEEAGYEVSPDDVEVFGSTFASPGAMAERYWMTAVEIAGDARQQVLEGDGSPMEEGAHTQWCPLAEALQACRDGLLEDAKTELTLRRLDDLLRDGR